jgi:hypothetical protein
MVSGTGAGGEPYCPGQPPPWNGPVPGQPPPCHAGPIPGQPPPCHGGGALTEGPALGMPVAVGVAVCLVPGQPPPCHGGGALTEGPALGMPVAVVEAVCLSVATTTGREPYPLASRPEVVTATATTLIATAATTAANRPSLRTGM